MRGFRLSHLCKIDNQHSAIASSYVGRIHPRFNNNRNSDAGSGCLERRAFFGFLP